MAKLYFRYGAMGAAKTANAIITKYNYEERGKKALFLNPSTDTRESDNIIKSRTGMTTTVIVINDDYDLKILMDVKPDCLIVDEIQFFSPKHIEQFAEIVDKYNIDVFCYGLKTNSQGTLFEGSKRLLELADKIEEIRTICWCGKKAIMTARIKDGKITKDAKDVVIGAGNEAYTSLCRKHWFEENLGESNEYNNEKNEASNKR